MIRIQKKKEKTIIRNDQLVFEEKDDKPAADLAPPKKYGMLRSLLMSGPGILLWTVLYVYAIMMLYYKIFKLSGSSKEKKEKTN